MHRYWQSQRRFCDRESALHQRGYISSCACMKKGPDFRLSLLCSHYLSSRVGKVLSCRRNSPVDCCRQKKDPDFRLSLLCSHYLSSRVGKVLSCRRNSPVDCCRQKKRPRLSSEPLCSHYLSSRAVTRKVLSAYMCLTSVFGMGTGGPT